LTAYYLYMLYVCVFSMYVSVFDCMRICTQISTSPNDHYSLFQFSIPFSMTTKFNRLSIHLSIYPIVQSSIYPSIQSSLHPKAKKLISSSATNIINPIHCNTHNTANINTDDITNTTINTNTITTNTDTNAH
jgi:hypothetical protein